MDVQTVINQFKDFIELDNNKLAKLNSQKTQDRNYFIVDFNDLVIFDPSLCDTFISEPEETFKAFSIAASELITSWKPKKLSIRIKSPPQSTKIQINKIRSTDINTFITVEGMIKRKSDVRAQITKVTFECPSCQTLINILQLDEKKHKTPSKCSCGRRSGFKAINKDEVDVFSIVIEEPTEFISGGVKLSQLKVLCRAELTDSEIERVMYQGVRAEVSGILKEFQITEHGNITNKIDWYLEANYIQAFDETFSNITWNEEDVQQFNELAKKKNWLDILRRSIFFDIHGYKEECEGVVLQMFGGVSRDREGSKVRGNLHLLLCGDPGSCKSTILKITQKFSPKSQYVVGSGVSGVGLTASVVKDELLGGYSLEAGALVLNNNGMVMIDELDKMDDEFKKSLHEALEQETVSISKASIQATLVCKTSVLAAANPKHGSYSEYDSVYSQIELSSTLINRFDLVYPFKESKLTKEDDHNIAKKILSRGNKNDNPEIDYDMKFIKKYIAYAKKINPEMPESIQDYISSKYEKLKDLKRQANSEGKSAIPITPRNVDATRRLIEAVARSRLHTIITEEDAKIGYEKLVYSIGQVGIDPESGEAVIENINMKGMPPKKIKDIPARICNIIRNSKNEEPFEHKEIIAIMISEGYGTEDLINEQIEKMLRRSEIYEPRAYHYLIVRK